MLSPCAKSKRGAVLFDPELERERERLETEAPNVKLGDDNLFSNVANLIAIGDGFNGPPRGFTCDGSDECRRDCPKLCLHAEQRAIHEATRATPHDNLTAYELVHVKVVDGKVVHGGTPSCWQCSRLVVESSLRGVWLYETQKVDAKTITDDQIRELAGAGMPTSDPEWCDVALVRGDLDWAQADHVREARDVCARVWNRTLAPGLWRFYTAPEFHEATLRHEKLHIGGDRG